MRGKCGQRWWNVGLRVWNSRNGNDFFSIDINNRVRRQIQHKITHLDAQTFTFRTLCRRPGNSTLTQRINAENFSGEPPANISLNFENGVTDRVLGNWTISDIYQTQTVFPFNVFVNGCAYQKTGLSSRARFAGAGLTAYANNRDASNNRV